LQTPYKYSLGHNKFARSVVTTLLNNVLTISLMDLRSVQGSVKASLMTMPEVSSFTVNIDFKAKN